ncbi:flavodoxin [Alkalicoccus luteus]|uniref:Flavodoxin n=1 Tax=Alkalicoccus luteus TaxID=1237094 RepID=A0A969PTW0_9BACI|nr:flavodoxin [Alkalicoccus luteus]NJP39044.1 flavodoxin [Alkalicoccus luteus]
MSVLLVYATLSGHTEELAELIKDRLEEADITVDVKEAYEAEPHEFASYDLVIIGTYTFGDGDIPDDVIDFYEELQQTDLTGQLFALFGSGDTSYEHFAGAVDRMDEAIREQQGMLIATKMKFDSDNDIQETEEQVDTFVAEILDARDQWQVHG